MTHLGGVRLPRRLAPPPAALDAQHLRAGRNDEVLFAVDFVVSADIEEIC